MQYRLLPTFRDTSKIEIPSTDLISRNFYISWVGVKVACVGGTSNLKVLGSVKK